MATAATTSSAGSWQTVIRQRLEERDGRERAYDELIDNYQRLARYAKQQRDRNNTLLAAAGAVRASGSSAAPSSSSTTTAAAAQSTSAGTSSSATAAGRAATAIAGTSPRTLSPKASETDNAVRMAYTASLESQLQTTRDELATLYKTQSQNAQRLLVLNEQMRTRDDKERDSGDEIRRQGEELARLRRREEDLRSVVGEKDKMIQMLQDELSALSLELNQVEMRNDDLKRDNASLLQRWLDRMNDEAERMNEGNRFLQEVDRRREGTPSAPGVPNDETTTAGSGDDETTVIAK